MANPKIIPKKSTVVAKVPMTSDLESGEICINHADKKLYAKHPSTGAIQEIGGMLVHSHDELYSPDSSQVLELQNNSNLTITAGGATKTFTLPSASGTFATLSDIITSGGAELEDLQIPDSMVGIYISVNGGDSTLQKTGTSNGKNFYTYSDDDGGYVSVYYTGSQWRADWGASGFSSGFSLAAAGNTTYPWQATWSDVSVTRIGTYNAALAPAPLAALGYSGISTKAARADHVHPLPTASDIGAIGAIVNNISDSNPVNTIRAITSTEYDALASADPNTIYFII